MAIVNVGLSHRFAPAEMLEKLAVPSAELGDVLRQLFDLRTDEASA
jgi:glutamyl-tRNA reductase